MLIEKSAHVFFLAKPERAVLAFALSVSTKIESDGFEPQAIEPPAKLSLIFLAATDAVQD